MRAKHYIYTLEDIAKACNMSYEAVAKAKQRGQFEANSLESVVAYINLHLQGFG